MSPPARRVRALGALPSGAAAALATAGFELVESGAVHAVIAPASLGREAREAAPGAVRVALLDDAPDAAARALDGGWDGFVRPAQVATDLGPLVSALVEAGEARHRLERKQRDLTALLELTQAFAQSEGLGPLLLETVARLAAELAVERCALVLADADLGRGYVVASSDRPAPTDVDEPVALELARYPEIQEVLKTRATLVIGDAHAHPLLGGVRAALPSKVSALAVVPVLAADGAPLGVLLVRSSGRAGFAPTEIELVETVAAATAVALRGMRLAREQRSARGAEMAARLAAEGRVRELSRYEELFTHVADGMAIVDAQGRVLAMNPVGGQILQLPPSAAVGTGFFDLLAPDQRVSAALLRREIVRGGRVRSDLDVAVGGERRTLSVGAGPLRSSEGRAILTFRDVTEERRTAAELRETKEFLERLIDASEDGVVACDLEGRVVTFNKSAERITGFTLTEARGRQLRDFAPLGQAEELARLLRSDERGGVGRLDGLRGELLARDGARVPVRISAAIVSVADREVGTVAIFADLREKLSTDAALEAAQQRLVAAEKQSALTALAGAAAHELNQPLTSVLGYAELLERRGLAAGSDRDAVVAIRVAAERMKDLVRRIGSVSRFETKEYVGGKAIIDLERAAPK